MQVTLCSKGPCCQSSAGRPRLRAATEGELRPPLLHNDGEGVLSLPSRPLPPLAASAALPLPSFPGVWDSGESSLHEDDERVGLLSPHVVQELLREPGRAAEEPASAGAASDGLIPSTSSSCRASSLLPTSPSFCEWLPQTRLSFG